VIVGWRGGLQARRLAQMSSTQIERRAIDALAQSLGVRPQRMQRLVERTWLHDWEHDPFSRGAYSYQLVGGADAPATLARPLKGSLFFAGEAADSQGATGTVHGAIDSGRRAAAQVLRALRAGGPHKVRATGT
jgi:monoamine oxidase